jgi:HAE1 family hydrophobic/amphiphilic exporter-1
MTLPELCIRRPVMTTLLMLAFVIFGLFSYRLLPVAAIPRVDFPTIVVSAVLAGASPESMASSVATPLERQFSTIAGLDSMTSTSGQGVTTITMQFNLNRNIDGAALDVQAAITSAARQLPIELTTPPSFQKVNPADQPVLYISLNSSTLPLSAVDEYAETLMAQRISMLLGVAQVQVFGSQKFAVRVQVKPDALAAKGISIADVQTAVAAANSNTPVGQLSGSDQSFTLQANAQLANAAQFRRIPIAYRNGAAVRLGDVATVVDSVENDKIASWYNGNRGVILSVFRQPDANTVEVVDSVRSLIPIFRAQVPPSVNIEVLSDRSISIRNAVDDVQTTLMITVGLVILVIFLFLRSVTATIIPALALPVSIIGTFAGMYVLGYSIDNLSLLALTLSVGFVVDDAIVMLENIVRHIEGGMRPMDAAFQGSREVAFTILSMTTSLVAVFIPVLFMSGVVGRVFREFAVTISMTILISGIVSLTLTPMLSSRMLKAQHGPPGRLYRASESVFTAMLNAYALGLKWTLRYKPVMLVATVLSLVLTSLIMFPPHWWPLGISKGFFPSEDTGLLFAFTEAAQDISFEAMATHQQRIADIVRADPNVRNVTATIGATGFSPALNNGRLFIELVPRGERKLDAIEVIQQLRREVAKEPGMNVFFQALQNIQLGGRLSKSTYQYTIQDGDVEELYRIAPMLQQRITQLRGFQDVNSDLQLRNRQTIVDVDRDKAAQLGITLDQVKNTLYSSFGTRQISTIYEPANDYQVILEVDPHFQRDPTDLSHIYLRATGGQAVPLAAIAEMRAGIGPVTVNHQGQLPSVTISFNLAPGISLGDAVAEISAVERQVNLPVTVSTGFQGTAQVFQESLKGQGLLLIAAVLVIYMVLGVLYESFIHPLTILSGLPSAGLGALITLMIFHTDLSVIAIIGLVMLIGIVKKNAIMMIDFALERQRAGESSPEQAIYEACLLRFRPIMMTTMAAIMGGLPIAIGFGAGSELRRPLGLAVVGGLLVSQLLTLFITPVIFIYLERARHLFERKPAPAATLPRRPGQVTEPGE